jgi:hypothetical protein
MAAIGICGSVTQNPDFLIALAVRNFTIKVMKNMKKGFDAFATLNY